MRQVSESVLEFDQLEVDFEEPSEVSAKEDSDGSQTLGAMIPGVMV